MKIITKDTNKVFEFTIHAIRGNKDDTFSFLGRELAFRRSYCQEVNGILYSHQSNVIALLAKWQAEVDAANASSDYDGEMLQSLDEGYWTLNLSVTVADPALHLVGGV